VTTPSGDAPERGSLRGRLAPRAARTAHIVAMGLVLGGASYSVPERALAAAAASIGSHMPKTWRHSSFLHSRVIGQARCSSTSTSSRSSRA
jgi:hypothetical protein